MNNVCNNCGESNEINANFCKKCGKILENQFVNPNVNNPFANQNIINNQGNNNNHNINNNISNQGINLLNDINKEVFNQISDEDEMINNSNQNNLNDSTNNQENKEENKDNLSNNIFNQLPVADNVNSKNKSSEVVNPFAQKDDMEQYNPMNNFNNKNNKLNYFKYMIDILLHPISTYKDNQEKYKGIKFPIILSLILIFIMTISDLVTNIFNNIDYVKIIINGIIGHSEMILLISLIYYVGSLLIKKKSKFFKIFLVVSISLIPFTMGYVLSQLLSLISVTLGFDILLIGFVYSLILLLELISEIINIENNDIRIQFHFICLSIIVIGFLLLN